MDPSFIPVEVVPSKTPFGLDQLRRSYKTALSAEAAIAAAPAVGAVDEVFPCMFLMPISTPESAESATRIDLLYMGTIQFTGTGVEGDPFLPVLPAQKHDADDAVQSASSSRSNDGRVASSPLTVQFYAPASTLSYFSFGAAGTIQADDPTDAIKIITLTVADTTMTIGTISLQALVDAFFSEQIIETHQSTEIVPGQYWQNVSKKTKSLTAFIIDVAPGVYILMCYVGTGYAAGDTLTISSGGESATISITAVGISGEITAWTVSSNTFTVPYSCLVASGGSGSNARLSVEVVT
jgi:hypothetical protein